MVEHDPKPFGQQPDNHKAPTAVPTLICNEPLTAAMAPWSSYRALLVRCAAYIQRGMAARYADEAEVTGIVFRIGINLGGIIVEGEDTHGDDVNAAAQ